MATHEEIFEFFKMGWDNEYLNLDIMRNAVKEGVLTPEEYEEITHQHYIAEDGKKEENEGKQA